MSRRISKTQSLSSSNFRHSSPITFRPSPITPSPHRPSLFAHRPSLIVVQLHRYAYSPITHHPSPITYRSTTTSLLLTQLTHHPSPIPPLPLPRPHFSPPQEPPPQASQTPKPASLTPTRLQHTCPLPCPPLSVSLSRNMLENQLDGDEADMLENQPVWRWRRRRRRKRRMLAPVCLSVG